MSEPRNSTSRWKSLCHACRGLSVFVSREPNARIHVAIATIVCIAGFWFQITRTEWALLALTIALVLSTEVVNTAIEVLADRVTREHDESIKLAKDMSAAAVLITASASVIIGLLIFGPKLLQRMIE